MSCERPQRGLSFHDGAAGQPTISGGTEAALIGGIVALANLAGELGKAAIAAVKACHDAGVRVKMITWRPSSVRPEATSG